MRFWPPRGAGLVPTFELLDNKELFFTPRPAVLFLTSGNAQNAYMYDHLYAFSIFYSGPSFNNSTPKKNSCSLCLIFEINV